ncbi:NAD-dependent succinate-semialdehyde dehydrogenase [Klenkia taihuensis]|uniref:Succinate-semialdehyde dehydrogenase / glutarate-semialdehyde dehydrogenase n=1 Tax=Klenkia taihuensis TaxID=1225127 RepID=A0A1I1U1Q0_9ACTN|nr:NAD-dependent succinate-semialdehyde dehydrogenase [Klenkia taihuensis]GHE06980.1 succinate-semialdehyde dehydrogenase [NADP(+)] [Klenkia taihuensis]SFD64689.1 succinate-semialdehyde dehydrogenase / glutarate-semialdehyde dehydrogenase [Klenkia taihuensis]
MSQYATVNPATGETVQSFPTTTDEQVADVLVRSDAAYRSWRRAPLADRAAVLQKVANLYRERVEELAALTTLEMGKPLAEARGEVGLAAAIYEYYATKGPAHLGDEELEIAGTGTAVVRTEPLGALIGIMPWNFPWYQVARFAGPNLLLGNSIVLKHAPNCPQQALAMEQLFRDAGLPADVYVNVFATNEQVADMIASPLVHGVSLTGSERAGAAVGEVAGRHLKKYVLELGGSDPFLVLADADVESAVGAAVAGRMFNGGQACTSSKRFIVHTDLYEDFVAGLSAGVGSWTMGDPTDAGSKMGPLSSAQARDDLAAQVRDAVERGATVRTGGVPERTAGAWFPGTVLTDVTPDMRAYREELFGPVAVVHRVGSTEEAVALANDSAYGLGASVFTTDDDTAQRVAEELETGMVWINSTSKSAPDLPFGGVKRSGVGRELGRFGLEEFCNKKLVRRV